METVPRRGGFSGNCAAGGESRRLRGESPTGQLGLNWGGGTTHDMDGDNTHSLCGRADSCNCPRAALLQSEVGYREPQAQSRRS